MGIFDKDARVIFHMWVLTEKNMIRNRRKGLG